MAEASKTYLVVDDQVMILELAREIISRDGYEVLLARSANEALALFQKHASELSGVLLDFSMPDMDGAALFIEMRKINPQVPVILTSGFSETELRSQSNFPEGVDGYLQKPFLSEELLAKLRDCRPRTE